MSGITKVAVVTGANKGVGFAIVKGLCEKFDGIVYLTSRDEARGKIACQELEKLGLKPRYHQLDITDENSIKIFKHYMKNEHGFIDILVNNAGILFLKDATEPKVYQAEQTIWVNFFSLAIFCEAMIPLVRDGGRIVNISSSSGHLSRIPSDDLKKRLKSTELSLEGLKALMNEYLEDVRGNKEIEKGWGELPYVVSKNAVNAYTFILHRRLADRGIKATCVHPGYVKTDMTRGGGDRSPEQGAEAPLMLALEQNPIGGRFVWHNGTTVPWDGPDPRVFIDGMDKAKLSW
ncbi:carbonyl reductase [NADPH] 3-like [Pectinophora gossypiella]|uniref:carbonyl reductase [NADPH] 3-like n=1 Tax=Pectinophora gossypiella TaxID=13191 RepID=UPI00214E05CE|nr:carbonyl reductase [NADPH] 3-like [Pectinophora gossypiella]